MKFMKLGTRSDTFYTEEATRTITSEIPNNLTIRINSTNYLLHTCALLPKCGLLQRLCSDATESSNVTVELHDIPGGEDAFELCAKFCYAITITLGAHNIVSALCAAKFLQMTERVDKGNFVSKLETFFGSCILEGWKDSIVSLQTSGSLSEWPENLGIIRRCIDSVVEKIITPPSKVTWSFTYTRPGYAEKRHHHSVPKDWWTEDIAELDIDLFRCIITTVKSENTLPAQLIGEALHVYSCRWLPDIIKSRRKPQESLDSESEESLDRKRKVLISVVSMIPASRGSVSIGFLLRLLSMVKFLGVSLVIKAELVKRCSLQFEEATLNDLLLLLPSHSSERRHFYDISLVGEVLESFLREWRRRYGVEHRESVKSIMKIGKLIDLYLQVVAGDVNMPIQDMVSLAEALPEIARPKHDDIYKAINIYLEKHDLTKAEKKKLCRILDCQKLSPEVCSHVVRNERMPLRTVVQVIFFERERGSTATSEKPPSRELSPRRQQQTSTTSAADEVSKLYLGPDIIKISRAREKEHNKMRKKPVEMLELEPKQNNTITVKQVQEIKADRGKEIREELT